MWRHGHAFGPILDFLTYPGGPIWQDHIRNSEVAVRTGLGPSGVGSHHTPPELRLRSQCQASWRHASPPSTPVSCRSDSRPSSRPKLEASPRPSQQPMAWPATQGQQHATSWPVEKIHHTWSFGSDVTVLDDYALTTTTTYLSCGPGGCSLVRPMV